MYCMNILFVLNLFKEIDVDFKIIGLKIVWIFARSWQLGGYFL